MVSQAGDYELTVQPTISAVAGTITPRPLSASATISGTLTKVYDGTTAAAGASLSSSVNGAASGDTLALNTSPVALAYNSSDVATANAIIATGVPTLTISSSSLGSQLTDYSMTAPTITNVAASITTRAASNWLTNGSGSWSSASNWDLMPTSGNVLAVNIPSGASVLFDATAGNTSLQSVNSLGTVSVAGGSLAVSNAFSSANYSQSGGAVSGIGTFTVSNNFSQTAGTVAMGGAVSVRQASGNLAVGSISGSSIALQAVNGAVSQTAPLVTPGLLQVIAANGATLTNTANSVAAFSATTSATGNVAFTNIGALDVQPITVAGGNLVLDNTGALTSSGAIHVPAGSISTTTHSPLTINNTVNANGNITLAALSPNSTSNITINGSLTSTAGGISVQAYNNFIQNAGLSAALAINVSAGGSLTFGPGAISVGNPVTYAVNGVPYVPPWIASTLSGGSNDYVVSFLDQFQAVLDAQAVVADDPLGIKQHSNDSLVVEGELCKP